MAELNLTTTDNGSGAIEGVAIIGMAGRFPGAKSVAEFWANQLAGLEKISRFSVSELEVRDPAVVGGQANYVRSRSILDGIDQFDAEFFGMYPREAALMDPQQRFFMESCWEACEAAGYDPLTYEGAIGVYGGCSIPTYFLSQLCKAPGFIDRFTGDYQAASYPELIGNGIDYLTSRVAYKLNLRGPAISMVTACSTSLIAVTQAAQALLTYQCDMALAGGVSISLPQKRGTVFMEGGMTSADGHCRTFDAEAGGTVFGSGCGVVMLKRAEDAVRDGDHIHAVIRGFGINNDGASKVGFTAPSVEGQFRAIATAHAVADVDVDSIEYIEAHGTGTPLGDPIELSALDQAFRRHTDQVGYCTLGTAKTNVGHLDVAAGVTGLIHATHVVEHGKFPPTLHYSAPNPKFNLAKSPFRINTVLTDWKRTSGPRRAGVSAFGVGGTNAHVILEQAPAIPNRAAVKSGPQILPLSARSPAALAAMAGNLAAHLAANPAADLADTAWTLQAGRRRFEHRAAVVVRDVDEAIRALRGEAPASRVDGVAAAKVPSVHFMFPGQGAQYAGMGRGLYDSEPVFRRTVDRCVAVLLPIIGTDLRTILYPAKNDEAAAQERLTDTKIAQPAIFVTEYALAQLWVSLGIKPASMIGHSVGEFVAACLAGVMTLDDALGLVAARGRLMNAVASGHMLSVRLSEVELTARLPAALSIAALNAPSISVVAGAPAPIAAFEAELKAEGVVCRRLVTSHAFHSAMMDEAVAPFAAIVANVPLKPPSVDIISSVTGELLTAAEATDPVYWARHLRQTVRFAEAAAHLRKIANAVLLEVGPGNTLNTLARMQPGERQCIESSLGGPLSDEPDLKVLRQTIGALWTSGVDADWAALHGGKIHSRRRVWLPTYPFERKRHWFEPPQAVEVPAVTVVAQPLLSLPSNASTSTSEPPAMVISPAVSNASPAFPYGPTRRQRIEHAIVEVFEDLAGIKLAGSPLDTTFLELGFDSLFLTQATRELQKKISLKVTFRQLLSQYNSIALLAGHAETALPAAAYAEPAAPVPSMASVALAPVAAPSVTVATAVVAMPAPTNPVAGTFIEQLMRDQLQVMNQVFATQLNTLRGLPIATPFAAPGLPVAASQSQPLAAVIAQPPVATVNGSSGTPHMNGFGLGKPSQISASDDLTANQRQHLDALVGRYASRLAASKSVTQSHRKVLADPRVVTGFRQDWKEMIFPVITNRSKGSKLWDLDGNEYIDLLNGFGPIMFGHRPDFIERAVEQQLREGFEIGPQTPLAGEIAALFCELTGNERMTFCNTGSEAVMAAMRIARTVTGRDKVVTFAGDYHGMFDEVLIKAGRSRTGEPIATPIAPGIPSESVSNMVVLDYGTPQSLAWIKAHTAEIAAVIVEPVQSRRPYFQPVDFLKQLREVTADAGTALVFDEVVTGFRTHPGGAQALFGIRADMATYGKVLGGGMPVGVLAGKSKFMDALDGGQWQFGDDSVPEVGVTFFAGTFVRHPLTLAAVKAILIRIKNEGPALQERLAARTSAMLQRINGGLKRYGIPVELANFKSFFFFKFPSDERFSSLFYCMLRENGVHVLEGFPCFLTTEHSDVDIDKIVAAFETAALAMRQGDFVAAPLPAGVTVPKALAAVAGPVPMTEPQREIFLAAMIGDDVSSAFNESVSIHLNGALDAAALERALEQLLSRHDALRSTVDVDGEHLNFAANGSIDLTVVDQSGLQSGPQSEAFDTLLANDARKPFDLHQGPLVRATLVKQASDRHTLVISAHHIVCDGWSVNVIIDDLAELYSANREARPAALAAQISFGTYAQDQARERSSDRMAVNEAFWTARFKDAPMALNLPADHPRGSTRSYAGNTLRRHIPAEDYRKLKDLGKRNGASLFTTLFAGFKVLIHKLSGEADIVVGVPLAGQALIEERALVGHCVNFLPLRTLVTDNLPFRDLLAQVTENVLDAHEHQPYTYGTLISKLKVTRDPVRLPLTELQFNVEQIESAARFSGLTATVEPNPKAAVNSDLFVNIVESPSGLDIDCDYSTGLFEEATVSGWLDAYAALLLSAARDPAQTVGELALPSDIRTAAQPTREPRAPDLIQIADWNATATHYPREQSVVALFEATAAGKPDTPAIVFGERTVTYGELNRRANQLARHLRSMNIGRGDMVACCMPRSDALVATALAILKAGAAYVPLDPAFPRERLQFMMRDTNAKAIVTLSAVELPDFGCGKVLLDTQADELSRQNDVNQEPLAAPDSLAYVIYTSGSTGRPKGVMIEHRAIVRLVRDTNYCEFGPKTAFLMNAPMSFDASTFEIWGALLNGGRVVVMPPGDPSLPELGRVIREHGVTTAFLTTGLFHVMVEQQLEGLDSLKQLFTGGEVLSPSHIQQVVGKLPNVRIAAVYGPTESTTFATFHPFAPGSSVPDSVPIGKPISNTRTYVLGEAFQPLPVGETGELYIAGDGLARGYLNLPELTAERFIERDVGNGIRERLYRTGDQVKQQADGTLLFLGRIDGQIKLRGFRIELGEIETALQRQPGIKQSCVVAEKDGGRAVRLLAFCIPETGSGAKQDVLRNALMNQLPPYMVPAAIVLVDAFPLNANGKIDREKLLTKEKSSRGSRDYVAPATPQERQLADIVAELMQIERVGATDNLFEIGVDSLRIFQITSRAAKVGLPLTTRIMLQAKTVRDALAEAAKAPGTGQVTHIEIKPAARQRRRIGSNGGPGRLEGTGS